MMHPLLADRPGDIWKNNGKDDRMQADEDEFDEEKEREMLEEAQKRKERAKKLRDQQDKMLAQIKAQKEAKGKQE